MRGGATKTDTHKTQSQRCDMTHCSWFGWFLKPKSSKINPFHNFQCMWIGCLSDQTYVSCHHKGQKVSNIIYKHKLRGQRSQLFPCRLQSGWTCLLGPSSLVVSMWVKFRVCSAVQLRGRPCSISLLLTRRSEAKHLLNSRSELSSHSHMT